MFRLRSRRGFNRRRRRRRLDGDRRRGRFLDRFLDERGGFELDHLGFRRGLGHGRDRLHRLHQPRRRQCRRDRFGGLRGLFRRSALLALGHRRLGKDVAGRQRDIALAGEPINELPRDDLFDCARRALDVDPVVALQQRGHFLARRPEQFCNFVNPDCGQVLFPQRGRA